MMKGKIAQKWKLRMLATTYFFERMKTNINTNQIAMDVTLSWNFSVLFAFALFLGEFDMVWRGVLWWVTYTSHINQVEFPRKNIISNWFEHVTYMCTISLILGRIISPTFEPPKGRIVVKSCGPTVQSWHVSSVRESFWKLLRPSWTLWKIWQPFWTKRSKLTYYRWWYSMMKTISTCFQ